MAKRRADARPKSSDTSRESLSANAIIAREKGRRYHLDRRAEMLLAATDGDDEDLLDTPRQAAELGVSEQWLEIGRCRGYGPPFLRLGPHTIRYRRGSTRQWLKGRVHRATAEYDTKRQKGRRLSII